ncbi:MAG: hypothetical protein WA268_19950 [Xanthobacteraceae bacterium]
MTSMRECVKPEAENVVAECFEILGPPEESGIRFADGWFMKPMSRNDPLGEMRVNGVIDRRQFQAGREWQACYVSLESSFWTGDEKAARQQLKELKRMTSAVGSVGASLFRDVLDKGNSIKMAAAMRGEAKGCGPKGWHSVFCACLSKLAAATAH